MEMLQLILDIKSIHSIRRLRIVAKNLWHLLLTNRINMIANMTSNTKLGNGMDMDNQDDVANHKDTAPIVLGPLKNDVEHVNLAEIKKNHERIRLVLNFECDRCDVLNKFIYHVNRSIPISKRTYAKGVWIWVGYEQSRRCCQP